MLQQNRFLSIQVIFVVCRFGPNTYADVADDVDDVLQYLHFIVHSSNYNIHSKWREKKNTIGDHGIATTIKLVRDSFVCFFRSFWPTHLHFA